MATYVYRTPGSTFTGEKFTFSGWFKRGDLSARNCMLWASSDGGSADFTEIEFKADGTLHWGNKPSGGTNMQLVTNRVFKDPSAWYHLVFTWDTTLSAGDRAKIYVNGVEETSFSTDSNAGSGETGCSLATSGVEVDIGKQTGSTNYYYGEMSHLHLCIGYAYAASDFGSFDSTSGIWKIKTDPSVTYGTNGWFLKMEDRTNLDLDSSPNAYTFTTSGTLTATYDNPSNNFCTLNPIASDLAGGSLTLGNNYVQFASDSTYRSIYATLGNSTGKYYFEGYVQDDGNATNIGIIDTEQNTGSNQDYTAQSRGYSYNEDGQKYNNGSGSSYGDTYASTNIIGCAVDLTNGAIWFSKNGTWQNSATIAEIGAGTTTNAAFTGLTLGASYWYGPAISGKTNAKWKMNFGNGYFADTAISSEGTNASGIGSFEYDVPTGFTAWSTKGFNE